ncbi:MAG: SMP-30/gluconolactonase/LRE family protein [Pseudomonadales bacterium]|mgnify:FL=1|nr:SMP-30/gluconolactonase/LRE family protein [Pseudomonadales bacterium]MDP7357511.1 SMP-30/gluconolactonase/LRE family protein [Pseudomonadales bacterium]MDP7594439.1 SMP-30/gluconolactonase/LRE family protein [Pseudomonadales bacterium]HJN49133.1 SMP-30/gluconolactonase/LRE family protein [Pseudomonadales bacterium]
MSDRTTILLDGLRFGEGPRWHKGRLWFSDMHDCKVLALDLNGQVETIVTVPNQPSGLGWLPDDTLLIVSMADRRLLKNTPAGLEEVADLSSLASFHCNDMVVDATGRAYIGNFGFDLLNNAPRDFAELVLVTPNGEARVVAKEMRFPNGTVITPDGNTLIVGETTAAALTAFDITADGSLDNRRTWAQLDNAVPDGICLDADDGIWVASPVSNEVLRVTEGGQVTDRIQVETQAFACMLGGEDRKTLFILTAESSSPADSENKRSGRVEAVRVAVAGAGSP